MNRGVRRHEDLVQVAVTSNGAARSALVASWRRSLDLHQLDPAARNLPKRLNDTELGIARDRLGPLIGVAQEVLDRLYLAVGGVGCCVLLADGDGVPVERRGAAADDDTFRNWGLWTGSVWSEGVEGTNGIGTCLVEERLLTIHRDQHFFARNTNLSCTTAPIFDHEGRLAAALDVSSCRADLTEGFVHLIAAAVGDAARRIEAENFRLAFPKARILMAPTDNRAASALVAVNGDDMVIGATRAARVALGISTEILEGGLAAADVLDEAGHAGLAHAERVALQRALAQSSGNVSEAARRLGISRATLHRKLSRSGVTRHH